MQLKRLQLFIWLSIFPLLLIVSLYMSWKLLSSQDFLYDFWYDNTKLEKFIDYYAPLNRYKPEFSKTNREERIRVFSETLKSVNQQGLGLAKISFHNPEGVRLGTLYQSEEIEHLYLVSQLVSFFNKVAIFSFIFVLLAIAYLYWCKSYLKDFKRILISYGVILLFLGVLVLIVKPVIVFTYLHELFFPEGHQWFFYYQDSLMTTLMMAPELFAYFAGAWLSSSLFLCALFITILIKLFNYKFKE